MEISDLNITFSQDQTFKNQISNENKFSDLILSDNSPINSQFEKSNVEQVFPLVEKNFVVSNIGEIDTSNEPNPNLVNSEEFESAQVPKNEKGMTQSAGIKHQNQEVVLGVINNSYSFSYSAKKKNIEKNAKPERSLYHKKKRKKSRMARKSKTPYKLAKHSNYSLRKDFTKTISESTRMLHKSNKIYNVRSKSKKFCYQTKCYTKKNENENEEKGKQNMGEAQKNWRIKRKKRSRFQNSSCCTTPKRTSQRGYSSRASQKISRGPNSHKKGISGSHTSHEKSLMYSSRPRKSEQKKISKNFSNQKANKRRVSKLNTSRTSSKVCASGAWNPKTNRGNRKRSVMEMKNRSYQSLCNKTTSLAKGSASGKGATTYRSSVYRSSHRKTGASGVYNTPKHLKYEGEYGNVNKSQAVEMDAKSKKRTKDLANIQKIIDRSNEVLKNSSSKNRISETGSYLLVWKIHKSTYADLKFVYLIIFY